MLPLSGAVSWRVAFDLPLQHLNLGHNIHDGCQVDVGGEIFVFYRNGHSFYNVTRKTRKSQKYLSSECRDERECHTENTEITEKTITLFVKTHRLLRKRHRVLDERHRLLKIPGLGIFIFVFVS